MNLTHPDRDPAVETVFDQLVVQGRRPVFICGGEGLCACHGSAALSEPKTLSPGRAMDLSWPCLDMTIPDLAYQCVGLLVIEKSRHKVRQRPIQLFCEFAK